MLYFLKGKNIKEKMGTRNINLNINSKI